MVRMTPVEIKNIRQNLMISQEDFARKIGVTISTIHRWEKGKSKPSKLALLRLKKFRIH